MMTRLFFTSNSARSTITIITISVVFMYSIIMKFFYCFGRREEGGERRENTFLFMTLISYQRIFLFSLLLPLSSLLSKQ
jgi:hypothetical protein